MESGTFWGTVVWTRSAIGICDFAEENWSGRRGSNPQLPAWEFELPLLYFHNLQNRLAKSYMHAVHTVHALPDLRIAAGRFSAQDFDHFGSGFAAIANAFLVALKQLTP